jgi:N-acetylmuramoyl-L-alanine amidase CwlA
MQTKQLYLPSGHINRPGTKITVTGVVVHWTANEAKGADAVANRNYFGRAYRTVNGEHYEVAKVDGKDVPFRSASAHLNVDDTELVEVLPWKKGQAEMGYHVGAKTYIKGITDKLGTTYPNNKTIGLEICVNSDGDFTKAYANGIKVIAMMLKEHGLGIDKLFRHYDVTGKACPGFFTDKTYATKYLKTTPDAAWAAFKTAVSKELSGTATVAPEKAATPFWNVYQGGKVVGTYYAQDAALTAAKQLHVAAGGKDTTIYVNASTGGTIYTPSKHPEDFPELSKVTVTSLVKERVANTDVQLLTIAKGKFELKLVWEPGKKVSDLVKAHGADYGINFPFFYGTNPVSDTKIGDKVIANVTTGKTTVWHGLEYKNGELSIGKFSVKDNLGTDGFLVKTSPLLVESGKNVQAAYVKTDQTASDIATTKCQRTAVGLDKDGNLLVVVSDGREGAGNVGLGLNDLANYLVSKDAVTALNGDGGGSSILANKSEVLIGNVGSLERVVNHALLIYLDGHKPTSPSAPTTTQYWRVFMDDKQQGAYTNSTNAITAAKGLYRKEKNATIVVKNPDGSSLYTPSKHPEDFV